MGRAKGERRPEKQLHHERILMFSEGRSYYYTFKPVIDAFLRRGVPFSYITMDVEDPALTIENDLMNSCYIGTGSAAFARAAVAVPTSCSPPRPTSARPASPCRVRAA